MELLDLYTSDRQRTGQTMERWSPVPEGMSRLVVHICVFNSKGQLLIQHRQPWKRGWSGLWDLSAGGAADAGESSQTAAERELREEIGVEASFQGVRPALSVAFREGYDDIYVLERDLDLSSLTFQPEEVSEAAWADREEVLALEAAGQFLPYQRHLLEFLFDWPRCPDLVTREDTTVPEKQPG